MIKVVALLFALSLPISEGVAQTVPAFPQGAEAAEARLLTKVGTQTRAAIKQEAVKQTFDSAQAAKVVQSNTGRSNLASGDIEILTYLALMEASRSAQEDVRAIMEGIKRVNAEKARLRQSSPKPGPAPATTRITRPADSVQATRVAPAGNRAAIQPFPMPRAEMDTRIDSMKNDLDSMSELGEAEQLRLQMAMDRLSKMMSTLSNLLKKISDTQSTLTQNLK